MQRIALIFVLAFYSGAASANGNACEGPGYSVGSGRTVMAGGPSRESKCIEVHYHVPEKLSETSRVVIVVPGAGRNAWDYRDAWIEASEKYNVLVLSPSFSEEHYPRFWNYNLAGMITDVEIGGSPRRIKGYKVSTSPEEWIYGDLDRVFNAAKEQLNMSASHYDAFGHSAGGQLLHRMTMFHSQHHARHILAGNSGWYTVPVFNDAFPYGLQGSNATTESVARAFKSRLVIFLGERDDKDETRGDLASSPEIDIQGPGRIERGRYFYSKAIETAREIGTEIDWEMVVVPDVGHEYRRMSRAAAEYLYAEFESEFSAAGVSD